LLVDINHTLDQITQLHAAQRHDESASLGTTILLELIAGANVHVLSEIHQDTIAVILDTTPVDLTARTSLGETLLHAAVRRSNLHVVRLLLFSNATQVDAQSDDGLYTALHLAIEYASFDIVYHLVLDGGVDGTLLDRRGRTPLHSACLRSDLKTIEFLIKSFPSAAYMRDYFGDTPIDLAVLPPVSRPLLELLSRSTDSMSSQSRRRTDPTLKRYRDTSDRLVGDGKWRRDPTLR
jgi:ankyrin repeat protein